MRLDERVRLGNYSLDNAQSFKCGSDAFVDGHRATCSKHSIGLQKHHNTHDATTAALVREAREQLNS